MPTLLHLLIALLVAVGIALAAWRAGALAVSGAVAAAGVGVCVFGFAGGRGAIALLVFFVTSSALSRVGKRRKERLGFEKGGKRDAGQVLANGGVAALCALLLVVRGPVYLSMVMAMLGALATANADTWATEIGSLVGGRPRRITDFALAEPGQSGAVSVKGTLAALAGALLIGLTAFLWGRGTAAVAAVTLSGFLGALTDSILGATVQAQYRDTATGRLTERTHAADGSDYPLVRGYRFLNNDLVNLLATLTGALLACIGSRL